MKRFQKNPQEIFELTAMAARILREISLASDAKEAELRFYFRKEWDPGPVASLRPGLGIHIQCGREETFIMQEYPHLDGISKTLFRIFDGLARLMERADEPDSAILRQLTALIENLEDER